MAYLAEDDAVWSWDPKEKHFDVLHSDDLYDKIAPDGRILSTGNEATLPYSYFFK